MKNTLLLGLFLLTSHSFYAQRAVNQYDVIKTAQEWKATLSDLEFYVLREQGTERPFTSTLLKIKQKGT